MKKKILFFHHSGNLGGAPKSLSYLIKELDKNIYDPFLVMIKNGPGEMLFRSLNIPVIVETKIKPFWGSEGSGMSWKIFIKNFLGYSSTYFRAKEIIKDINPDIIHLNTTCFFPVAMAAKKINRKIKIISHVREPLLKTFPGKILKYMNFFFVDQFVSISKFDESTIKHKENSLVVYNAVDFDEFNIEHKSKSFRDELQIGDDEILVTYLGRVIYQNGLKYLIDAAKLLKDDSKIKFAIIGFTEEDEQYQNKIKKESYGIPNIIQVPFRKDTPNIIASSDIIVFPSVVPHFARSVIEAAAMGKPSIASNIGGPAELIVNGETGLFVPPKNSKALANAIKYLAEDEFLRFSMGQEAYELAKKKYDSKINAQKVFQVYE
jgi:glycosyltransferase involved in cell wall biosynthesis